jgi:hypothetical protein
MEKWLRDAATDTQPYLPARNVAQRDNIGNGSKASNVFLCGFIADC